MTGYTPPTLPLRLLAERLAVARLDARDPVPAWAAAPSPLAAVVRTADELSVLTREDLVPADARAERGWRAFVVQGPLPFDLVGIFAAIAQPLAESALPIFALSTFDTDYVLVKEERLGAARAILARAGHTIED